MTIRALLFDLDGTLIDSLPEIGGAMNDVLQQLGHPLHSLSDYRFLVGQGLVRLVERALPAERLDQLDEACVLFREIYTARACSSQLYEGIAELLEGASALGLPMAVCSNKPHAMTEQVAAERLAGFSWAGIEGERAGRPPKPDPAAALELAERIGVAPAEVAFVGDTKTDMQTGVNAGMVPVGVLWGFRDRAELESHGAQVVVSRPDELLDWLRAAGESR